MITEAKVRKIFMVIVTILVVGIGIRSTTTTKKTVPDLVAQLAACNAFPNGSKQNIVATTRLNIKIPKIIFPSQIGEHLKFKTESGTATAGWISNAGSIGQSYGTSAECWSYYYEFDGYGEVDLIASRSSKAEGNYLVRFIVAPLPGDKKINYRNDQYGFRFVLPKTWKGYSVLTQQWIGYATGGLHGDLNTEKGPQIIIRNPHWNTVNNWQPIPIMVFTRSQWSALQLGKFLVSAAPIRPTELGRNSNYIFALPPRYNYTFTTGWQGVAKILESKPLHAF